MGSLSMPPALLSILAAAAFPGLMAMSASMDLLTMTIPNAIPVALTLSYGVLAIGFGLSPATVALGLACGLATLLITFFMFCRDWIGGGDAKLAAAIALWLGWDGVGEFALVASVCGGVLTLAILALRVQPLPDALIRRSWIARLASPGVGVPYGIALAAAGLIVFPASPVWRAAIAGAAPGLMSA
jgi:prepilin peptidase CpaA